MSLKLIRCENKLRLKQAELEEAETKKNELEERANILKVAFEDANSEEELKEVEENADSLEREQEDNTNTLEKIKTEIELLNNDINEIRAKTINALSKNKSMEFDKKEVTRGENMKFIVKKANTFSERKIRMQEAFAYEEKKATEKGLEKSELREFTEKIHNAVKTRAIVNSDLLIPEVIMNMIVVDLETWGNIASLVKIQSVSGKTRIIMSGDAPEAIWVDCCDPVPELGDLSFGQIELDCYKLAGFISICNATLEDAFIDLAAHIQEQMVKGYKIALDKAIINGTGSVGKQLTGIVPSLPTANKVTSSPKFEEFMQPYLLLPEKYTVNGAVMTKKTYVENFMPQTVSVNSNGQIVMADVKNPVLPDGTPVKYVKNSVIPDGQVLVGDFNQYMIGQRKEMTISVSTEVRFIEDQTVFKIVGRSDGRPIYTDAWVLITLTETLEDNEN